MLLLRLSTLTLALAHITSQSWLRHVVVANSIVGSVYMVVEMERLRTEGSQGPEAYLGYGSVKLSSLQNAIVNLIAHLLLPAAYFYSLRGRDELGGSVQDAARVLPFLAIARCVIDVERVYPMGEDRVVAFHLAYIAVVLVSMACFVKKK